jgi:hypothetical protein
MGHLYSWVWKDIFLWEESWISALYADHKISLAWEFIFPKWFIIHWIRKTSCVCPKLNI